MSTKYIASNWRLPNQENSSKSDNYGLDFDGSNDYISTSDIRLGSTYSISLWFNADSFPSTNPVLISQYTSGLAGRFFLGVRDDGGGRKITAFSAAHNYGSTVISTSTWYNVVLVNNNNTVTLYLNGAVDGNFTFSSAPPDTNILIGSLDTTPSNTWDGSISEVAVFDYALSATQISTLYGSSSLGVGNPMALKPQPVAFYPLGDNSASNPLTQPNEAVPDASVFDFDSDYIDVSTISLGTTQTLSWWINRDSSSTQECPFGDTTSGLSDMLVYMNGLTLYYRVGSTSLAWTNALSTALTNQKWCNIILTRNGASAKLYLNGDFVSEQTLTGGDITAAVQIDRIGASSAGTPAFYINGKMSNVVLWSTDETAEISNIYNSGVPATTYTNTPTAWYKLDQSANWDVSSSGNWTIPDASGNGNDGTSSGMTSANLVLSDLTRAVPYDSYSFSFDQPSNDYIDCGNAFTETGAFTISAWINTSTTSASAVLFKNGVFHFGKDTWYNGGAGSAPYLSITDLNGLTKTFRNGVAASGTTVTVGTFIDLKDGNWHNITFTYNGTNQGKYYTDGNLTYTYDITDVSWAGTLASNSNNLFIGATTVASWTGKISNCSIFNETLTSTEVLKLYSNGVPQDLTTFTPAPVAWWTLGSNSFFNGTNYICRDLIGSNDGTSANAGVDAIQGNAPRSEANGTGTNMDIESNITGSTKWSDNNSWSINMSESARVEDTP